MPRIGPFARTGWGLACCVAAWLAPLSPALAFEFVPLGSGAGQRLTWYWEAAYPARSCTTHPTPCGDFTSSNSAIPLSTFNANCGTFTCTYYTLTSSSGGSLVWSGTDSLRVAALTVLAANASATSLGVGGYSETWVALNARDEPLTFLLLGEPGDPPTTNLRITPRLLGSFTHTTTPGAYSHVQVQLEMAVAVNGVQVSRDSLYSEWEFVEGADGTQAVAFPKGQANDVTLPEIPVSSQIQITLWAYGRIYVSMPGPSTSAQITSTSPNGAGPSIVIVAQPLGVTAVGDESPPRSLGLRAVPNPSAGSTRVRYALPRATPVRLSVYDIAGHRVATLIDRSEAAGDREVAWSGRSSTGVRLPAGIYLLELVAGAERAVTRMVILGW